MVFNNRNLSHKTLKDGALKDKIRNKKKIWNKSSFTWLYVFLNFSGISWFLQNSGIHFIVMANTKFLPHNWTTCLLWNSPLYVVITFGKTIWVLSLLSWNILKRRYSVDLNSHYWVAVAKPGLLFIYKTFKGQI